MKKLGQILVERGWLTLPQLNQALQHQRFFGGRLGTCLLELNLLGEDRLVRALGDQLGVPGIRQDDLRDVDKDTLELVPVKMACRTRVVPFARSGTQVSVALVDIRDLALQDELSFITSKRVKVHVAPEVRILEALEKHYGCEVELRFQRIWDRLNRARYMWQEEAPAAAATREVPTAEQSWAPSPPPDLATPPPQAATPAVRPPAAPPPAPPAATEAAPPPPAARERPSFVEVPDEFRGVIPATTEESTRPVDTMTPARTLDELRERLDEAAERDEIASGAVGYLASRFPRLALFMVRGGDVAGWVAGVGLDREALAAFVLDLDQPSVFVNLKAGSPFFRGPLPRLPSHRQLAGLWGGEEPREALLVPVRIKDRLVAALYADRGQRPLVSADVEEMLDVAGIVGHAFETFLVKKKQAG